MSIFANNNLIQALRGEDTDRIPFWEVWYAMPELTERLLGHTADDIHGQISLAKKLGWEYVRLWIPGHGIGGAQEVASDGSTHYVQQGKIPLEEIYSRPEPDYAEARNAIEPAVRAAHDAGMAAIGYLPWCFHSVSTALGLEHLSYLIYDEPEYIDALMEWVEEGNRRAISEIVIPCGIDIVLFDGDCAYKNGLMVRPSIFRELVFERTQKTIKPLLDNGTLCVLHSDGKLDELIPILIELGFSGVHGVEAQANDLRDIKNRFGKDITLIGNMDVVFLTYASPEEVRAETEKMLKIGSSGGRYIAACNTSPLDYIPHENYLAMVDVINHFRK